MDTIVSGLKSTIEELQKAKAVGACACASAPPLRAAPPCALPSLASVSARPNEPQDLAAEKVNVELAQKATAKSEAKAAGYLTAKLTAEGSVAKLSKQLALSEGNAAAKATEIDSLSGSLKSLEGKLKEVQNTLMEERKKFSDKIIELDGSKSAASGDKEQAKMAVEEAPASQDLGAGAGGS